MNIFQKAITPDMPRVLEGEQIYVYVPQATSTNAGIASYTNSDFKVNDGVVSLRWPVESFAQGPIETPSIVKVLDNEFEYTGNLVELVSDNSRLASNKLEVRLKRDLRDAYEQPELVLLDPNYFARTIVEKDGKRYYKYNTTAIHYNIPQHLNSEQQALARENISASSLSDLAFVNSRIDNLLQTGVYTVNGKSGDVILKTSDIENDSDYASKDFVNSSIATSTSTFRGTYDSLEALLAYDGEKDDNDYAFVNEVDDTGNSSYNRYKYDGQNWVYEYKLNNSSFTDAQWSSINSGATEALIAQILINQTEFSNYLPLTAGSKKHLTGTLYADGGVVIPNNVPYKSVTSDNKEITLFRLAASNAIMIGDSSGNYDMATYSLFRPVTGATKAALGSPQYKWNSIHGIEIYQNGEQVANKSDLDDYLPLTAGSEKPLTGPLHLKSSADSVWSTDAGIVFDSGATIGSLDSGTLGLKAKGSFYIRIGDTTEINVDASSLRPSSKGGSSLGTSSYQWLNLYATNLYQDGKPVANQEYVDQKVADLVGSAPETLNTLVEIAAALKDNADIVTVLEEAIASKAPISSVPTEYIKTAALSADLKKLILTKADNSTVEFKGGDVYKGTCETGSTSTTKVVTCPGFVLEKGAIIDITFKYSNGGVVSLNVNNTGAKTAQYYEIGLTSDYNTITRAGGADKSIPYGGWSAGDTVRFFYDGSDWIEIMNLTQGISYSIPYQATNAYKSRTQATTDNSTNIATTAFVHTAIEAALEAGAGNEGVYLPLSGGQMTGQLLLDSSGLLFPNMYRLSGNGIDPVSETGVFKIYEADGIGSTLSYNYGTGISEHTGAITFTSNATYSTTSQPTALSYGRLQAYGTLNINANTDNSGTEYVNITAGHGCSSSTADGLSIGTDTLTWKDQPVIHSGNINSYMLPAYKQDSMSGKCLRLCQLTSSVGSGFAYAVFLVSGIGDYGGKFAGSYLVTMGTRGSAENSMKITALQTGSNISDTKFGYATDPDNSNLTSYYWIGDDYNFWPSRVICLASGGNTTVNATPTIVTKPSSYTAVGINGDMECNNLKINGTLTI